MSDFITEKTLQALGALTALLKVTASILREVLQRSTMGLAVFTLAQNRLVL